MNQSPHALRQISAALVALLFLLPFHLPAQTQQEMRALETWTAGAVVSKKAVEKRGIARCFTASSIPDAVFARMKGKSFPKGCTTPRDSLSYLRLLHVNAKGETQLGEMVCARAIANDLVAIFRALYQAQYRIERMVLIDEYGANDETSMTANNTSCFCFRTVSGTARTSLHARGRAVDINPLYNPYVVRRSNGSVRVEPAAGKAYVNRKRKFPYKITTYDLAYRLFTQHGFTWGGKWSRRTDYQHFEKRR